jgi:hypothetical protein
VDLKIIFLKLMLGLYQSKNFQLYRIDGQMMILFRVHLELSFDDKRNKKLCDLN